MLRTTQFTMEKMNRRASRSSKGNSAIRLTNPVKYVFNHVKRLLRSLDRAYPLNMSVMYVFLH